MSWDQWLGAKMHDFGIRNRDNLTAGAVLKGALGTTDATSLSLKYNCDFHHDYNITQNTLSNDW